MSWNVFWCFVVNLSGASVFDTFSLISNEVDL